jgi:homoserine kinase
LKEEVMTEFQIRVPASTSNLGPGFDALGLALSLYLTMEVGTANVSATSFTFEGEGAAELNSAAEENLIYRAMQYIVERERVELKPARFHVTNEIPLARGLGSSAAAILAGFSAFEVITGTRLPEQKLLDYATEMEHHSDNVAAALLGSFVVSSVDESGKVSAIRMPFSNELHAIVVIPDFKVRTEEARRVVPLEVSRQDAVFNIQRAALFVAALAERRYDLLREAMRDQLHQPYRAPLVPGLEQVLRLLGVGGIVGAALSGSGPTVFALATNDVEDVKAALTDCFTSSGIACAAYTLAIDMDGRRITM